MKYFLKELSLITIIMLSVNRMSAYDFIVNGICYNKISGNDVEVTYVTKENNSYNGEIIIPKSVIYGSVQYSVTRIGISAFSGCSGLTSVTIPDGVTSIRDWAFEGCSGLTSVTIPEGVTSIGAWAFDGCSRLTLVTIPEGVTSIGICAFSGCSGLTSVNIPDGVTSIENSVFSGCSGLTSVNIPDGVTSIGNSAFKGCSGLISVSIPDGVTSIGNSVFSGCSGLTLVSIPDGVTSIGDWAFSGCSDLTSVTIPDRVTSIGNFAFSGCSGLTSVTIPSGVTSFGNSAFGGCSGLTSVTIPSGVTSIGNSAFSGCSGLTSVTIPSGVTSIGDFAFYGCSGLTSVTIPEGVTSIGNSAFGVCSGLTSVTIPAGVTSIGNHVFYLCNLSFLTIGEGIESINDNVFSFSNCDVILPKSVKKIGKNNFKNCFIILFNGNVTIDIGNNKSKYIILDNAIPVCENASSNYYESLVLLPKKLEVQGISIENVQSLTYALINRNVNYTGYSQSSENGLLKWNYGDKLREMGINFEFPAIDEVDCGHYKGKQDVTFRYNKMASTVPLEYDYTISPVPLTITVNNKDRIYGDENPEFDFDISGQLAEDNKQNIFTQVPILTTEATLQTGVGTYPIKIQNAIAKNYIISANDGILEINRAPLVVQPENVERRYGDENPELAVSYVGFKLDDDASSALTSGAQLSVEATKTSDVGVYPITATGVESRNYVVTKYNTGTLTITKAPLSLTANNTEREYCSNNPNFDFTLTGLLNGDDKSCITKAPDFACAASLTSNCGEYEIIPSNAVAKNYDISYQSGKLKITKAPLSIAASDVSREYGDPNPIFEFNYNGFKNDDDTSALSSLPTAICNAKVSSPVGYYDIEPTGAEALNYNISYATGILSVKTAPLTIRAKDTTKTYGSDNPDFELLYSGFKNGDDKNALTRLPKISTRATKRSSVGDYSIIVSDAEAQNYSIEYEPGVLTVFKSILKAKVNDATQFYGDENPKFSVDYTGFLNGETESVVTTKPQFHTEADRTSKVGTYDISAFGATSTNYDIEYQNGSLTIKPRQISASVGNYKRNYGVANPEFVVEYAGFVNSDDSSSITTPTVATCDANLHSSVGNYPISLSGGKGENYEVTSFTNGVLTVEKADQTIEWDQDLSSLNKNDEIELTATASSGLPITYDMASNYVVDKYTSGGKTFIICNGIGTVTIRATQPGNENYNSSETITKRVTVVSDGGIVDPGSQEISINVTTPGTLSTKIADSKKYQIKNLAISGSLNGTDIRYIREMAGRDVNGIKTPGILEKLNLSLATIVSGGDYYFTTGSYSTDRKYTSDNRISEYMFYGCSTITNLTLPQNCTHIGAYAFDGCLNLSNIGMPDGIKSIGEYAFNGDISLSRISMPEQTTSIGNYAFQNCTGLKTLILSSSVNTVGDGILNGCTNMQEITLANSSEYYSTLNGVLYDKARTRLIVYPAGKQLQTFEVPDGVEKINNFGFYGASALKNLFLPESLETVGTDAFKGCGNLSKLFSRRVTHPDCQNDCFEAVSKSNCSLYVPRGSRNDYWVAPVWADFLNIVESNDLSVGGNIGKPDYGFEFTDKTLFIGRCTNLPVSMNNVDPVVAFSCDITLPDGVALYEDTAGKVTFQTSDRFPASQMFDYQVQTNGDIRIISSSSSNEAFSGTEGILFYVPLVITDPDVTQNSEYELILKNIEFTKKNQSGYAAVESPDVTATLSVGDYMPGDANGDGKLTILDAIITRGYFLGRNPANFVFKAADMNNDGKISLIDVVNITDAFLTQNRSYGTTTRSLSDYQGVLQFTGASDTPAWVSVDINLPDAYRYTAIQMDVTIPSGYSVKGIKVGDGNKVSHNVKYHQHPNGMTRVFISSDDNSDFSSCDILSLELEETNKVHDSNEILVDEVLAVEISGRDYLERSIEGIVANISDITQDSDVVADNQIEIWAENKTLYIKSALDGKIYIYDVAGHSRLIEINSELTTIQLVPGIYIINNKKIIIK